MSGSDEDMSANSNISSTPENSGSPLQLVPQLTMPPMNTDAYFHGMVSIVFIIMIILITQSMFFIKFYPKHRFESQIKPI